MIEPKSATNLLKRPHDAKHNNIQHNNKQKEMPSITTQSVLMLVVVALFERLKPLGQHFFVHFYYFSTEHENTLAYYFDICGQLIFIRSFIEPWLMLLLLFVTVVVSSFIFLMG
jgi:hypothetical protein